MKFAWIDQMAERKADADHDELWWFSIALACEVLEVSTSGFYDWRARRDGPPTAREREQAELLAEIRTIHKASNGAYGSPRVYAELRDKGWVLGENRVARVMAAHGIQGRSGRTPGPRTTRPAKAAPDIPDLVKRDFASVATAPDRLWCSDLTYVPTAQGWLYLTVILDACSRAIVGWAAADHMRTSLMTDALAVALGRRDPDPGLIVHSDRGSQYTSDAWLSALEAAGALPSMGRVGWCWDNAMAESWFATFKNELVHPIGEFATRHQAHIEIANYVRWHNLSRRHSALGQLAPAVYERALTMTDTTRAA